MNWKQLKKSLGAIKQFYYNTRLSKLGRCGANVHIEYPISIHNPRNVYLEDNTCLKAYSMVLNTTGKFIMKENAAAAQHLTVVTGNHHAIQGLLLHTSIASRLADVEKDVTIEEDALLGVNVTLLCGVTIGRGCIVGAGAVVRKDTPPYSIVIGNPARILRFIFTPEEIIEHEQTLYPKEKRLPMELLEENYQRFIQKSDR